MGSSIVWMLFGLLFLVYSLRYPFDTIGSPGPAVFPFLISVFLIFFSGLEAIKSYTNRKKEAEKECVDEASYWFTRVCERAKGEAGPIKMTAVFVVYLLAMVWVGFFVSTFLFVFVSSRLMGSKDFLRPIALSLGIVIFCYILFEVWLKVSFPRGILF
ncbi:MAG: tripartite tricarboxylate transporter TctB family protein [Syntrophorhabdaceae bacterium]|nr:tripartite tricarboxylate transporter TctB family protein [Syntrophorhabdaceae bacterium]